MDDFTDLEDYIKKTEDGQLSMMVDVVRRYNNDIYDIIKHIKDIHVGDNERDSAKMIFTTVHRSKGMEYDAIQLTDDFITEDSLIKKLNKNSDAVAMSNLNEEINMLYVAITRTKGAIHIPDTILHTSFNPKKIHIVRTPKPYFSR